MPAGIELGRPLWLLAIPIIALLLLLARRPWLGRDERLEMRDKRGNERRVTAPLVSHLLSLISRREARRVGLRLGWTSLLVFALADPVVTRPLQQQAILFAVDASASVAEVRDQAESAVRAAVARREGDDLVGVVAVAGTSQVEEPPTRSPLFTRLGANVSAGASDLAAGLRLAGALVPGDYRGRVVLVSDGRQTQGDAVATARELARRGTTVDVFPLGSVAGADVRLDAAEIAELASVGEVSTLLVRLTASRSTLALLRVFRDDELIMERGIELRGGSQEAVLPVPVGEPGLHRYRVDLATADPSHDSIPGNNVLGAVQRVIGPPRILIVATDPDAPGFLPGLLQSSGAQVSIVAPSGVPADLTGWARFDLVVLADVPADALPAGAMAVLERTVRELGRGMVMTGGPDSFGPGGYVDTPIEQALPVWMDVRGRGRQPRVAMVLVIDKSGSMSGQKMEMAKEAAARSVRLLQEQDQAAVLAFDSVPQWAAFLTPAADRARLESAIGGIFADGGTEIYPALAAAFGELRDVQADVRHIILLTDGRSGSAGDYGALLQEMREARVTLSTIGVGTDADNSLLEAMARVGRGRFHFAGEPASIPQIFSRETVMATRALLVDTTFIPSAASAGPLLRGLTTVMPLDGYVATTPKDRAEVVLVSPDGDPVLAAWQYGAGRAVAWTPDLRGRWSSAWAGTAVSAVLWGNVLSWLLPPPQSSELALHPEADGAGGLALEAENRTAWEVARPTRAELVGPRGIRAEVEMTPFGPGRYRAQFPAIEPGAYLAYVTQSTAEGAELKSEVGWVAPYPAEYRESGIDQALLTQVAAAGGGRVLTSAIEAMRTLGRPAQARWPLAPVLLVLAALLWPLEVASRRLSFAVPPVWRPHVVAPQPLVPAPTPTPDRESPARPPVSTAERLLERKRALERRR
jgi:Ca-activated chloride channel homolog